MTSSLADNVVGKVADAVVGIVSVTDVRRDRDSSFDDGESKVGF